MNKSSGFYLFLFFSIIFSRPKRKIKDIKIQDQFFPNDLKTVSVFKNKKLFYKILLFVFKNNF